MGPIQIVETYQRQKNAVVALADIFDARFVGIMAEVVEVDVTGQVAAMTEKRAPSGTFAFADSGVTWAAKACNEVVENLLALSLSLLRHHVIRVLGCGAGSKKRGSDEQSCGRDFAAKMDELYPHKTAPPFTLMTSPVMKLARSEAAKRIGPAISSGVPARRNGITVVAIFWPALVSSTGLDISVATQPGATQFTRILCRASSVARPLVKLMMPPLEAP